MSISPGGYGIIWNDELDLSAEEVWVNGWPEWDEDKLVTVEIQVDAELYRLVAERLKPYGLTPEDGAVMALEALVFPATQDKAIEQLRQYQNEEAGLEDKEEP